MTTPKFDRLAITQAVLAEDVYIDKNADGQWQHRHRETADSKELIITYPDGTKTKFEEVAKLDKPDGFQGVIYRNKDTNELHGVIRGSETREWGKDIIITDGINMGLRKVNNQFDSAREFNKLLMETAQAQAIERGINAPIYLAGHSLGGTIAQYLAHYNGDRICRTDTFNAFGAAALGYKDRVPADRNVNVFNHRMSGDIVSKLGDHYGKVITYGSPTKEDGNHSISNFTYRGQNAQAKDQTYVLADPERWQQYKEFHVVPAASRWVLSIVRSTNLIHWGDTLMAKIRGPVPAGQRADKDGVLSYHAGQCPCISESDKRHTDPIQAEANIGYKRNIPQEIQNLSPQTQSLYNQINEKVRDLCTAKGIYWHDKIDNGIAELTLLAVKDNMPRVDTLSLNDKNEIVMMRWGSRKTGDAFMHNLIEVPDKDLGNKPISEIIPQLEQQEKINEYNRQAMLEEKQNQQTQAQSRGRTM